MPKFQSTKTYGTDRGLSCCFRQWKANHSHCSTLHGYSLGFKFVWESETLDEKNWCFDFGGMKPIKEYLDYMFDHTVLVAEDDPAVEKFKELALFSFDERFNGISNEEGAKIAPVGTLPWQQSRICDIRIVPGVGCELTAKLVYDKASEILEKMKTGELGRYAVNPDVRLVSVECFEHGANSAIYYGDEPNSDNALKMLEDMWFSQKGERRVFTVDTGNMSKEDIQAYVEKVKTEIQQRSVPDCTKIVNQIETLLDGDSDISDLQYFTHKLALGVKIPLGDKK